MPPIGAAVRFTASDELENFVIVPIQLQITTTETYQKVPVTLSQITEDKNPLSKKKCMFEAPYITAGGIFLFFGRHCVHGNHFGHSRFGLNICNQNVHFFHGMTSHFLDGTLHFFLNRVRNYGN